MAHMQTTWRMKQLHCTQLFVVFDLPYYREWHALHYAVELPEVLHLYPTQDYRIDCNTENNNSERKKRKNVVESNPGIENEWISFPSRWKIVTLLAGPLVAKKTELGCHAIWVRPPLPFTLEGMTNRFFILDWAVSLFLYVRNTQNFSNQFLSFCFYLSDTIKVK